MRADAHWLAQAVKMAAKSPDPDCKVGAVIVDQFGGLVSSGWNGFPDRVKPDAARLVRPGKFLWIEHAERSAIYNAAAIGELTNRGTIYTTRYPCAECARAIILAGLRDVFTVEPDWDHPRWDASYHAASQMLAEAGVRVPFAVGVD